MLYCFYALYLHPLRNYPGPKLCAITRIPFWIASLTGNHVRFIMRLHKTYGSIVRIGPNDLSYTDGVAWKDVYVVRKGEKENSKDLSAYPASFSGAHSIFTQNDTARHATVRHAFAPAFSEKALRAQEPIFQQIVDSFIARCGDSKSVDLAKRYNCITFDVMAKLILGETLGMVEGNESNTWADMVSKSIKVRCIPKIMIRCSHNS